MPANLRPSAKAVVLRDGRLLVTRNLSEQDPAGEWLLLPGGGQRAGEDLHRTLIREVGEETGFEVRPGRLLWIREYIGAHHEFADFDSGSHQIDFMFAAEPLAQFGASEPDDHQVGWEWVPLGELADRRFYPGALLGPLAAWERGEDPGPVYLGDVN